MPIIIGLENKYATPQKIKENINTISPRVLLHKNILKSPINATGYGTYQNQLNQYPEKVLIYLFKHHFTGVSVSLFEYWIKRPYPEMNAKHATHILQIFAMLIIFTSLKGQNIMSCPVKLFIIKL